MLRHSITKPMFYRLCKNMMKLYRYYDKVLSINPSYVDALNGKASGLEDLKIYDEASATTTTY